VFAPKNRRVEIVNETPRTQAQRAPITSVEACRGFARTIERAAASAGLELKAHRRRDDEFRSFAGAGRFLRASGRFEAGPAPVPINCAARGPSFRLRLSRRRATPFRGYRRAHIVALRDSATARGENRMARQVVQIAADTGQIYALCDDGEIFRFSGETWHHVSPIPQGDPRDATKPKQKPGFIHVDDEPGG
jgi:hypothetical protein